MKIKKVEVKNFRILEDVCIDLDDTVTLIVGRNNTGKTSLAEIFYKFFCTDNSRFRFEDFSISVYENLKKSVQLYDEYITAKSNSESNEVVLKKEELYKSSVPKIEANIFIEYKEDDNLASLSHFIMDLNPERKDVMISCEFAPKDTDRLITSYKAVAKDYKNDILEFMRKNLPSLYSISYYAVDNEDRSNKNKLEEGGKSKIEDVFLTRFINAQRILDDQSTDSRKGLSKGFGDYYKYNNETDHIDGLKKSLVDTSVILDGKYKDFFKSIFDDLKIFGVNTGINIQELEIKSNFEVDKVLKDNANLYYKYGDELLPESHNGLGYSNLIFIILHFFSYFEEYCKRTPVPNFSLMFIEEPEAHLHPQMQQTFIKNITKFIKSKGWNIQVVVTTHSSHIVSESGFENIRYFDKSDKKLSVKNLTDFKDSVDGSVIAFLRQYMTLYNCDMFFADKIILVEGTVEKLLLPSMIQKVAKDLEHQYVSIIEVGGAYAHNFKEILNFINVKTLVIADIDSINSADSNKKCEVKDGDKTCNAVLKKWIPKKELITELLSCTTLDKVENKIMTTYQVPEETNGKCGRSFEEAFILKNATVLSANVKEITTKKLFEGKTSAVIAENSYAIADIIPKKTDFAFDILILDQWEVPRYIQEGLLWLKE